ncbi:MAG TPA: carboxypeptidase-like regulatory domain-containing protein, partial [Vicinamibacterales bacterium]|nr:carboxypeptidase-like regulatory domain-containing protein [Vicinamibacterales bacterium]
MLAGFGVRPAVAQMPDVRAMSGVPLPSPELPAGTVTVRLVRGSLANNLTGHPVELVETATGRVRGARTDESGRARFGDLAPGMRVRARAVVEGETLESEEFAVPASGGVRLVLVAGAASPTGAPAAGTPAPGGGAGAA